MKTKNELAKDLESLQMEYDKFKDSIDIHEIGHKIEELELYKGHLLEEVEKRSKWFEETRVNLKKEIGKRKDDQDIMKLKDAAISNMHSGISITKDPEGEILYTNRQFDDMFGYNPGELRGKHVSILNAPLKNRNDVEITDEIIDILTRKGLWKGKLKNIRKNGSTFWSYSTISRVNSKQYGPVWVCVKDNITENIELQEKARHSAELMELFFKDSHTCLVLLDKDFNFIRVNEAYAKVCGRPVSDFPGKNHFDMYPSDVEDIFKEVRRTKAHFHIDARPFIFPDHPEWGTTFWDWALDPILNESGEVEFFVFSLVDVTKKVKAEEKMNEARAEAERANLAKSEFLANMSHEIRSPMTTIVGMSNLLGETVLTKEQGTYVKTLEQSSETLLNLISDILDLSRIESGLMELNNSAFNLPHLIDRCIDLYSERAGKKGIEIKKKIADNVPERLTGDAGKIQQVLMNLIGNALKFTRKGSINIEVTNENANNPIQVNFAVSDTGIGIPKKKVGAIFNSFVQGDSSITRQYGGTGLGLSICKRLVGLMGGVLSVESKFRKGSRFYFTIPLKKAGIEKCGKIATNGKEEALPLNLLLVEDSEDIRSLLSLILRKDGFNVDLAVNGSEGIKKFMSADYDLILMDIQMPVMDGYTACSRIRKLEIKENKKKTPIIALTAYAFSEDREKCIQAGFDRHMTKPVMKNSLIGAIKEMTGANAV